MSRAAKVWSVWSDRRSVDGVVDRVSIYEAKTHLSQLVARAERGEQVILTRHGRPVATLGPVEVPGPARVPGAWRGQVVIGPDFDEVDDDEAALWSGA